MSFGLSVCCSGSRFVTVEQHIWYPLQGDSPWPNALGTTPPHCHIHRHYFIFHLHRRPHGHTLWSLDASLSPCWTCFILRWMLLFIRPFPLFPSHVNKLGDFCLSHYKNSISAFPHPFFSYRYPRRCLSVSLTSSIFACLVSSIFFSSPKVPNSQELSQNGQFRRIVVQLAQSRIQYNINVNNLILPLIGCCCCCH